MTTSNLNALAYFMAAALFTALATISDALQIPGRADIFDIAFYGFVAMFVVALWQALTEWAQEGEEG